MNSNAKFRIGSAWPDEATPTLLKPFYTVSEAASLLGKSADTVTRWCKSGELPAYPETYGKRIKFRIPQASIKLVLQQAQLEAQQAAIIEERKPKPRQAPTRIVTQLSLLPKFRKACLQGLINGRPFSEYTARYYHDHLAKFLDRFGELSADTLKDQLLDIPAERFATRDKLYKATICFAKFLAQEKLADETLVEELKPLKPRRHLPPKRVSVDEAGLGKLEAACRSDLERLYIVLLSNTGLRAGEFCALRRSDVDLQGGEIAIRLGKGGKSRHVGLTARLRNMLADYLAQHDGGPEDWLFPNDLGQQMDKDGINKRLKRIGKRAGIEVTTHALRRAFVTVNAKRAAHSSCFRWRVAIRTSKPPATTAAPPSRR